MVTPGAREPLAAPHSAASWEGCRSQAVCLAPLRAGGPDGEDEDEGTGDGSEGAAFVGVNTRLSSAATSHK
jgi:hypothetical protein